ncbi:uncharacterized protein RB166_016719 [Leptodactylus fuscus]
MAPTALVLLSVLLGAGVTHAILEVSVEPKIVANPGQKVQLKCVLQGLKDVLDPKDIMVLWFRRGKQIAEFDRKINIEIPGLSMSLDALKKGDGTLTIESFTTEHAGNYRCHVYYKTEHMMKETVLSANVTSTDKEADADAVLSSCETVLDKKLDKVIDWISKVEGKLSEVTQSCGPKQDKKHGH